LTGERRGLYEELHHASSNWRSVFIYMFEYSVLNVLFWPCTNTLKWFKMVKGKCKHVSTEPAICLRLCKKQVM